jgi:ankyrin repeat protein
VSVLAFAALALGVSAAPARQCRFDPTGYFYPKAASHAGLEAFDHVTIWDDKGDHIKGARAGVYGPRGEFYAFRKFVDRGGFVFETAETGGVSFTFEGKFDDVCVFEESFADRPENTYAEGTLAVYKGGKKIAEASLELGYSPTTRESKEDVNARYPSGMTRLSYAAWKGDEATLSALIAKGADVNVVDVWQGMTPLDYALRLDDPAQPRRASRFAKRLIAAGADVNVKGRGGETPLMRAAGGDSEVFKLLLRARGADPNVKDDAGKTALMWAVSAAADEWYFGYGKDYDRDSSPFENVRALLRAGAGVNERDADGETALSIVLKQLGKYDRSLLTKAEMGDAQRLVNLIRGAGAN